MVHASRTPRIWWQKGKHRRREHFLEESDGNGRWFDYRGKRWLVPGTKVVDKDMKYKIQVRVILMNWKSQGWEVGIWSRRKKEYFKSSKMTLADRDKVTAEIDLHCSKRVRWCRADLVGREETKQRNMQLSRREICLDEKQFSFAEPEIEINHPRDTEKTGKDLWLGRQCKLHRKRHTWESLTTCDNLWLLNFQTHLSYSLNIHWQSSNQNIPLCWLVR